MSCQLSYIIVYRSIYRLTYKKVLCRCWYQESIIRVLRTPGGMHTCLNTSTNETLFNNNKIVYFLYFTITNVLQPSYNIQHYFFFFPSE